MNRILVPYDFSPVADHAVDFACQLAEQGKAKEVLLLNVIEHPSQSRLKTMGATEMDPMENVYFTKLIKITKEKLEARIAQLGDQAVDFKYKIELGSPYHTLVEEVAEESVNLVIMGTAGSDGLEEFFVGSNAEKVVRTAKCPVITMNEPANVNDINDIVFASTFHDVKSTFVNKLKELQAIMGAKLRLVKINTPANFYTNRYDVSLMKKFVQDHGIENYTTDIYNHKNEEDGIVYYAEDIDADMIALGTNQRTGFDHFLSGSIAEDVVNHSKRPVWTMDLDG